MKDAIAAISEDHHLVRVPLDQVAAPMLPAERLVPHLGDAELGRSLLLASAHF